MLAIRDDDTSFWTNPEDLIYIYGDLLKKGGKLCLAVVPESYQLISPGDRTLFYINKEKHFIYENHNLVGFLQPYVNNGQIEIMLHGYDHSYSVVYNNEIRFLDEETRKEIGPRKDIPFLPECVYKDLNVFKHELNNGRQILEETFNTKICTFVPPSNAISADVVKVIDEMGMNISGTILPTFNRKLDVYSIYGYFFKFLWKIFDRKHKYPYIMRYKNHKELVGHAYTPLTDYERYNAEFLFCQAHNYHFTMATHYWEIAENKILNTEFKKFLSLFQPEDTVLLKEILK